MQNAIYAGKLAISQKSAQKLIAPFLLFMEASNGRNISFLRSIRGPPPSANLRVQI